VLAAAGIRAHLAGGTLDVPCNMAGLAGIGLLCAAVLGGALTWADPRAHRRIAVYGQYTQWHSPALTTPWIWPARPPRR
jgi:hypothetical protein